MFSSFKDITKILTQELEKNYFPCTGTLLNPICKNVYYSYL